MNGVTPSTFTDAPSTDGVTVGVGITASARASRAEPRPPSRRIPRKPATSALPPAMTRRRVSGFQAPVRRSSLGLGRSRNSVSIPAAVPSRVGSTSGPEASGREMTAAIPSAPTTPSRTAARRPRRLESTPIPAHAATRTTTIPMVSASLSFVPNVETAKSLSHGGVRSMKAPATAGIGEGVPPAMPSHTRTPASRVATPIDTAPAMTPSSAAPQIEPGRRLLDALVGRSRRRATTERRRDIPRRVGLGRTGAQVGHSVSRFLRIGAISRNARPRCEIAFFSSSVYSARVRGSPSDDATRKIGS